MRMSSGYRPVYYVQWQGKHRKAVAPNSLCVCSHVAAGATALADLDLQIQIFVYFKHLTAVLHDNVKTVDSLFFVCV